MRHKRELYMTAYQFKDQEDVRHKEEEAAVVRLFVQHKQSDLLPMLGLEAPKEDEE